MAHATANKKVTKVKATSHPTHKTQPLAKGHMPIRRVPCVEEACRLRRGPKGQAAEPRTGPPAPTEKDAFQTASCGRWPRCGRAQSLSRLYTVGGWEVGWGHRPCETATANRHQAPKCPPSRTHWTGAVSVVRNCFHGRRTWCRIGRACPSASGSPCGC